MPREYLIEFTVSFMVEADTEQEALPIADAFLATAIDTALWERDGSIRWATLAEQDTAEDV